MFDYQLCILVDSIVQRAKGAQILGFPLSLANRVDCRLPFRKFRSSITRTFVIRVRTREDLFQPGTNDVSQGIHWH